MLADKQELIYMRTLDVVWKTCQEPWMTGMDEKRVSAKSMVTERVDDDDDDNIDVWLNKYCHKEFPQLN